MTLRRFLTPALAVVLLAAAPVLTGCDTTTPGGPTFADIGIRTVNFTVRANDFDVNADGDIATYQRTNVSTLTERVVDEGVVLLYASGDLIFVGGGASSTWTALPYTQGIEAVGDDGVPYVDYTITYGYSFEPGNLYIDVISSAVGLVEDFLPHNVAFRLVTIPPDAPRLDVDLTDYDAVVRAYGLDD